MRYTGSRNRRFLRQKLIQEAQQSESSDGMQAPPRQKKTTRDSDGVMVADPNSLPSVDTVLGALSWIAGGE